MQLAQQTKTMTTLEVQPAPVHDALHGTAAYLLSNLYVNPEEAVIREYVANALDATEAAGSDALVDVKLPDALDQDLIITDHGVGMTHEQALWNWAAYGNSTKHDDKDAIGALGAGAKSGFSVASMIHLETTHNGQTTNMTYVWNDAGPQPVGVTVEDTGKPSGTTITIAVNDLDRNWERAARRALAYTAGRVRVDGQIIEDARGDNPSMVCGMAGDDPHWSDYTDRVVMGGMSMRLPKSLGEVVREMVHSSSGYHRSLIIEVPNKSLEFSPSRDDIKDTQANADALRQALQEGFVQPLNNTHLGDTCWETYVNIRRTDGRGTVGGSYVTAEISDHLNDVTKIFNRYQHSYNDLPPTRGFGVEDGRRVTLGRTDSGYSSSYYLNDFIEKHDVGTDSMVFVHDAESNISRSPKIRGWLLDQDKPSVVVALTQADEFAAVQSAGLHTMTAEELRTYKVQKKIATAASRAVQYNVVSLADTSNRYSMDTVRLTPDEIREHYDLVFYLDYYDSLPTTSNLDRTTEHQLMMQRYAGQRVGVVKMSAQTSLELAIKRIDLPEADLAAPLNEFVSDITSKVPAALKERLAAHIVFASSRYYNVSFRVLREDANLSHTASFRQPLTHAIPKMLSVAEQIAEGTGIAMPAGYEALRDQLEVFTNTEWIDELHKVIADISNGIDTDTVLRLVASNINVQEDRKTMVEPDTFKVLERFNSEYSKDKRFEIVSGDMIRRHLAAQRHEVEQAA